MNTNTKTNTIKLICSFLLFAMLMLGMSWKANAQITYTWNGNTSTDWNNTANWTKSSGTSTPGTVATDIVVIPTRANQPTLSTTLATNIASLTFTSTTAATLTITGVTLNVTGAVTLNSNNGQNTACTITGTGTLSCASVNVGLTTVSPILLRTSTMTSSIATFTISGTLALNASRSPGLGTDILNPTFTQSGGTVNVGNITTTVTTFSGSTDPVTCTYTMSGTTPTLNITGATPFTLSATPTNTLTFNSAGATVNYTGAAQTDCHVTTYHNLTLSGTLAKTFATPPTINGVLSMEGTATMTITNAAALIYGASATLQYNTSTARTAGVEWVSPFAGSGGVVIMNTGAITLNAAKSINQLSIASGASLNLSTFTTSRTGILLLNNARQSPGSYGGTTSSATNINPTYFGAAAGLLTVSSSWTGATNTDWATSTNWSGGAVPTATDTIYIPSSAVNQPVIGSAAVCGILEIASGASLTISGSNTLILTDLINAGTITANASTLSIGGVFTNTGSFIRGTGTVNYTSAAQTAAGVLYHNLTLSGSGTKTLQVGTTSITGNLTLSGTAAATTVVGLTVGGNLLLGDGTNAAIFTAAGFALGVTGTTTVANASTLAISSATGTKTFTGAVTINAGGTLSESAAATLAFGNDVNINGTLTEFGAATVSIAGSLTNNGTYTASTGVHTFSGATKTIGGTTTNTIPSATFTGTYTNGGTLTSATLLTVTGVTLTNTGTINSATSLTGTGTLSNTSGTVNITGGSCSITTNTNAGTFAISGTATSTTALANFTNTGTINISGSGAITGITNNAGGVVNHSGSSTITSFNNATSTSTLNISSAAVPTITTLTATAVGNTVNYTGAAQTNCKVTTYNNLTLSGSLAKTFATPPTINGVLSMEGSATMTITNAATLIYGSSATLQYNTSIGRTASTEWVSPFPGSGGVVITNTGTITLNAAKLINTLSIASGAVVNLGTFTNSRTGILLLNNATQSKGTHGGTGATATYINTTYFEAATGVLMVSSSWTGATNTDWATSTNWSDGTVPIATDNVYIPSSAVNQPTIGSAAVCGILEIVSGATLTISGSNTLTLTDLINAGTITANASTLSIGGVFTNTGTFTRGTGTVNYTSAAQTAAGVLYHNLTLSGSGTKTLQVGTTSIGGNLTLSGTASATTAANLTISGNLLVGDGTNAATFTAAAFTLGVTGTTTIANASTLAISSATGTKTFTGAVTINSGGTLSQSAAATLAFGNDVTINGTLTENGAAVVGIAGNLTNNGTYTASTGVHTFSGATKTIGGTTTNTIPSATFTGIYTNNGTLTVGTALAGAGTLTQGSTGVLNIGGTSAITTLTATAVGNTVNYTGAAQTCNVTTYHNLTLSGTLAKTFATAPTVNGILSLEGTAAVVVTTGVVNYGAAATLQYNKSANYTATSEEWVSPFTGSGGVVITNTGAITLNAAKVINKLSIASGAVVNLGTFTNSRTGILLLNNATQSKGSYGGTTSSATNINPTYFTAATGVLTVSTSWTGATNTDWATSTNWSDGAVPIATDNVYIPSSAVNQPVIGSAAVCGILEIASGASLTISGSNTLTLTDLSNAGTITANASTLSIGGVFTNTGTFTAGTGTVNYSGAAQTVTVVTYNNLALSGSGTKTLQIGTTSIAGNLILIGTASTTTVANLTILGDLYVGDGASAATFTAAGFTLGVTGTTTVSNASTLAISSATGTKTFTGAVTINNGGTLSESAGAPVAFGDNLTNNGTYTASTGNHTFSGTNKSIGGTTTNTIPTASFSGAYTNSGTLTCATVLTVFGVTLTNTGTINSSTSLSGIGGTLSNTSGTVNITGGSCSIASITNAGTIAISSTASSSTVHANFTNTGTINISTSGTIAGITNNAGGVVNLSGSSAIASFNNATSTSTLNISTATPASINTLTATAAGNTVNYTGAVQTVISTTYANLILSGSGVKTTTTVTVNGILSMEGTATASVAPTYGASATLQYNTATGRTAGVEWVSPFTGSGGVVIQNTGAITLNAAKVINKLSIASGAVVNLGTFTNSRTGILLLNNATQLKGTHGGTGSGATYINTTFFGAAAGLLTVTSSWTGATNTDWGTSTNWSDGTVPISTDYVIIPSSAVNQPTIGSAAVCGILEIASGATLTISGSNTLTLTDLTNAGTITANASTISIGGAFTNTGTFTAGTGTVNYSGAAQTVTGVSYNNLTLSGSGTKTLQAGTTSIGGNLTLSGTAAATTVVNFTIGGNLLVGDGTNAATFTAAAFTLGVTGTTTIANASTLAISSATGTKTFTGAVTINNGGALSQSAAAQLAFGNDVTINGTLTEFGAAAVSIAGNLTNNGTYTASTGVHTFSGTTKTIGGTTTNTIPSATFTGTYTNNGTLTVGTALAGAGTLTQGASSILNIGGTSTITTLTATAAGNTVHYTGAAQTCKVTTYHNLTLSGTLAKTFATPPTINGVLSMEGSATMTITNAAALIYGPSATLQYNTATGRTASTEWVSPFPGSGGVVIMNTGAITLNAVKLIPQLSIAFGASLNLGTFTNSRTGILLLNNATQSKGSYGGTTSSATNINPTYFGAATGILNVVTFWTGNTNTDWGTSTNWSDGAVPIASDTLYIPSSAVNQPVIGSAAVCGILEIASGASLTISGSNTLTLTDLSNAGTITANASILSIGGTFTNTGTFIRGTGTVNYTGAAQTAAGVLYHNLTLSGSGTKTLQVGTTSIAGNLILSGTATATTVVGLTVGGNLSIGDGTTFNAAGFALTVTGTTTVGGGSSGDLTITSATGAKLFTGLVTIAAGATWTNNTANAPVTFRGGITNNGTFTAGSGVHTFNVTASQALNGTLSIPSITVASPTVLTNTDTLTVATALAGTGGLTQASNATLNIGGTSAITTMTATASGNTVNFTGAAQTVNSNNYVNLNLAGSGSKSLQSGTSAITGNLTLSGTVVTTTVGNTLIIGGNLTIEDGTTFSVNENCPLEVNGATTVGGNLTFEFKALGSITRLFKGLVTISATGTWLQGSNGTGTTTVFFEGGISNSGIFTANAAEYVFQTNDQALTGTISIPDVTVTGVTLTNNATLTVGTRLRGTGTLINTGTANLSGASWSITALANAGTINRSGIGGISTALANFTNTGTINISSSGAIAGITNNAGGVVNHSGASAITSFNNATSTSTLNISTTPTVPTFTTLTTSAAGNTVNYTGAGAQTVKPATYSNLILSGSGTKTTTSVTVNGILSMEGTATASAAPTYGASATLQYNTATGRTAGVEWVSPFTGSGGVIIQNTGAITLNAAKVINTLSIASGAVVNLGTFTNSRTVALLLNNATQSKGSYGGTTSSATNIIPTYFATATGILNIINFWTGNTNTDWATSTNWSDGTVPISTDYVIIPSSAVNQPTIGSTAVCGMLEIASGATLTISGSNTLTLTDLTNAGTITANASTISIGGAFTNTGTFTAGTGTVNYSGAAQTVTGVSYNNLTLSGSGTKTLQAGTTSIGGNLTLSGTASATTVANLTISGNLLVGDGTNAATFTAAAFTLGVTGTTTIANSSTLAISSATGTKTFSGAVTINAGGTLSESAAAQLAFGNDVTINGTLTENGAAVVGIAGNLTNNGTYTASTGVHTFSGATKTIGGTTTNTIASATFTGTYTNNGTLTVGTALAGAGTLTQGSTGVLNIGGTSATITLNATSAGNTVNYTGAAQTCKITTYHNLTLSGTLLKSFASPPTINGILSMEGTATSSNVPTYGASATLQYNTATGRTAGVEWVSPFTGSGGVIIQNTGAITLNAAKVTNQLSINSGASVNLSTFTNSRTGILLLNNATQSKGSYGGTTSSATNINPTYFGAATGILNVVIFWSGNTNTDWATSTNWSDGTVPISTDYVIIPSSAVNQPTIGSTAVCGMLEIASGATLTISGSNTLTLTDLTNAGNIIANASTISIGGAFTNTGTFGAGTVNYSGAAQTVAGVSYNNLTLSGSGTKTLPAGITGIGGNLTLSGTASATTVANLTISGNLLVGDGTNAATFTAAAFTLGVTGTTTIANASTLAISSATGTKTFNGAVTINAGGTLSESVAEQLAFNNDVTINGTLTEFGNAAVTIFGSLTNNGTYTASTGVHTFSGGGTKTIGGTSTNTIPSVTFAGNYTNSGTLTCATALTVNEGGSSLTQGENSILNIGGTPTLYSFTANALGNTVNYYGAAQGVAQAQYHNLTLSGSGIKTLSSGMPQIFGNLTLSGTASATTAANLTIAGNLLVGDGTNAATFTAAAFTLGVTGTTTVANASTLAISSATGTKTFTGAVTINSGGTLSQSAAATLAFGNDVTINGTLTENGAAVVGIAGSLTNNGTYTASTGVHTFSGTTKTIGGTTTNTIPSATFTGTYTNNGTLTVGTALAGAGTLTQGSTGVLNIGGTSTITTLTATVVGNTVNYTGAAQTCKVTTYRNLTILGTSAKTFATPPTVNGILSLEGTASVVVTTGVVNYGAAATLQYNKSANYTATSEEWVSPFTGSGGVIIQNTGAITLNAAKLIPQLSIASGAKINLSTFTNSRTGILLLNNAIQSKGTHGGTGSGATNINPTYFAAATGILNVINFWTGNTNTDWHTSTNWSDGAVPIATDNVYIPSSAVNQPVIGSAAVCGILEIASGASLTISGSNTLTLTDLSNAGTITANASTISVGGVFTNTGTFTSGTGTVNYSGAAQTVTVVTYNNLTLSGSGTKTLAATTISSNLSISGTAIASLTGNSTAATLTLDGYGKINGTWGSTSSSATNQTNTYFSSTGIVTVSTDTRPALTITANNDSKTYGQTFTTGAGSANFTSSGLLNGETIGSVTIASTGAADTSAVGSYTIVPSAATGGTFTPSNYNITYTNGTLTVNEAPITITANNANKTYGTTQSTPVAGSTAYTITSGSLKNSETIGSVTLTYGAGALTASAAVGSTSTITPSAASGGTFTASNYTITYSAGTLTVTTATLTVTASAQSKNYESTASTVGILNTNFTVTGLQNSDAASGATLTYSGSPAGNLATAVVGSYTITPSALTLSSGSISNYSITYNTGTLTVNAVTNNWTGGTGNWNTAGNWSLSRVPSSLNDNITVSNGSPTLDVNYTLGTGRTFTISGTGGLVINPNSSLTIAGTADCGGKPVTLKSDATGTASIGQITGTLNNATNMRVERFIPAMTPPSSVNNFGRRWRFISSPVQDATLQDIRQEMFVTGPGIGNTVNTINSNGFDATNTNSPSVYFYNEADTGSSSNGWTSINHIDSLMKPGIGYRLFVRGDRSDTNSIGVANSTTPQTAVTMDLRGTLNQGNISIPITYTNSGAGNENKDGWNLIGNPYASAIDWDAIHDAGRTGSSSDSVFSGTNYTNLAPSVWVYNPVTNTYEVYSATSNIGTGGLSNGIIASGQSFWIKARANNPTLTITESHKTTSVGNGLFKNTNNSAFYLQLIRDSFNRDEMAVKYITDASTNKDIYDVEKIASSTSVSSWGEDNLDLTISCRPTSTNNDTIRLNVGGASGIYHFHFKNSKELAIMDRVTLIDTYDKTATDLMIQKSYAFNINTSIPQTFGRNRFYIVISENDMLNVNEKEVADNTVFVYPNPSKGNITIQTVAGSYYQLVDIEGRIVKEGITNAQTQLQNLEQGVYFLRIEQKQLSTKVIKIVVTN
jgi:helix-turn-helix protein